MPAKAKGYSSPLGKSIERDKYYILSLKDYRNPILLRIVCDSKFIANTYIITKLNKQAHLHEVIRGDKALDRNIKISTTRIKLGHTPTNYNYPLHIKTPTQRKTYRGEVRRDLKELREHKRNIKQYTIKKKGKIYTLFATDINYAFTEFNKWVKIPWKFFIKKVNTKPQEVKKHFYFIRTYKLNTIQINKFLSDNGINDIKYTPSYGKIRGLESPCFLIHGTKPKTLIF